jgi:polyphosphate glucokinase
MNVLVVDVGWTHVKILATGKKEKREFASGPRLTAPRMVSRVRKLAQDWKYQVVSIGYPGPVLHNRPVAEPRNLAIGWMGFYFEEAFERPTKIINDAAMQALGSYRNGKMLFLGLGTGLGSTVHQTSTGYRAERRRRRLRARLQALLRIVARPWTKLRT